MLGYGSTKAWPLVSGPKIRFDPEQMGIAPGVITLSGEARNTETLTLNGGILLIDDAGNFEKTLTLPSGGAVVSLTATDRFGRSVYERRTLLVP
jgi:hypothetical protein